MRLTRWFEGDAADLTRPCFLPMSRVEVIDSE